MSGLQFFCRRYTDPVVEYYFLPSRSDVRLTARFGKIFVHRLLVDVVSGNRSWFEQPVAFTDIHCAEQYALALPQYATTAPRTMPTMIASNQVCEATGSYRVA